MICDQQRLQVSPNTYHSHARRKGYGRSHHSTQKTRKDVLIQSRNIFFPTKTSRSKLPENIWLSACEGGAASLFPSPCWAQEVSQKLRMQDTGWRGPARPQLFREVRAPPAPSVRYLRLHSAPIHRVPPFSISLPRFDTRLIALFPMWFFCFFFFAP